MPKVTEEYRVARRDEIADAALRAFRRKGFQATSMAEIIAESGLSAGAIYGHYASKDAIIVDVASRVVGNRILDVERLAQHRAAGPAAHPPPRADRRHAPTRSATRRSCCSCGARASRTPRCAPSPTT